MSIESDPLNVVEVRIAGHWHGVSEGTFRVGKWRFQDVDMGDGYMFIDKDGNEVIGPIAAIDALLRPGTETEGA